MVDFSKLLDDDASPALVNPVEIFRSLPRADTKYDYLRDVQGEVLKAWHARRAERDTVVKMNTGSGKTLVGLLMLQSLLNEGIGPALYLCPTRQLVDQVHDNAVEVGIPVVRDGATSDLPNEFLNSEAIYVTTFHKLFNGRSVFGIPGSGRSPVAVGGLLVDDAHRCLAVAREKVTVTLDASSEGYKKIYALFRSSLREQSASKAAEIEDGYPWTTMPVPYWAWMNAHHEVAAILVKLRNDKALTFSWDLLKEHLQACYCFISGRELQITPHLVPIESIPSFANARRRFFLSATLIDDSVLLKEFGVTKSAAEAPIRPPIVGDIGERMILAPALIDKSLEAEIPGICASIAQRGNNVVILVPSFKAAERWEKAGATVPDKDEVSGAIETLRTSQGNFIALANRYDGIDLPENACRVLVLDGVPTGDSYYDQYVASVRLDSTLVTGQVAQNIEQGLGRGVRSGKDYCVVLLSGSQLVQFVGVKERLSLFSPETRQQFLIGQEVVKQSKADAGPPRERLLSLIQTCLMRNASWKAYHAKKMSGLAPVKPDVAKLDIAVAERTASLRFASGSAIEAGEIVQRDLDPKIFMSASDKGWFLQLAATYFHGADPGRAQEVQRRAYDWNRSLVRPLAGIRYQRMIAKAGLQAHNTLAWVSTHSDPNAIVVSVEALINRLVFGIHHAEFEAAWAELGAVLGFAAQRPEEELGKGPDGLWAMPENHYLLTEIKNDVDVDRTVIHQNETEQLSNSTHWFTDEYGADTPVTLLFVHPATKLAPSAYPPPATLVMTQPKLDLLHTRLRAFAAALATKPCDAWTATDVGTLLTTHRLDAGSVRTEYALPARQ
ncbi:MAG TPA: DEAD/DEAH box helicase [Nitrospira sp.]|nr:DEAD/DEAH box helicase [Nitrospira sp.]